MSRKQSTDATSPQADRPAASIPRAGPANTATGPGSPSPNGATSTDPVHARSQKIAREAEFLGKRYFSAQLASTLNLKAIEFTESYGEFLVQFIEDAGNPTDPVERALLEQVAVTHFRIGSLHALAAGTASVEGQRILINATARLMGEWRKMALAWQTIRSSMPKTRRDASRLKLVAAQGRRGCGIAG